MKTDEIETVEAFSDYYEKLNSRIIKSQDDNSTSKEIIEDFHAMIWLEEQIKASETGRFYAIDVELTPALCRVLLALNPKNRLVRTSVVKNYLQDMKNASWQINGEVLKVSVDGLLNDGQHRCLAVIEFGKPIIVDIGFGFTRDSRLSLDQGIIRRAGDFIGMNGTPNGHALGTLSNYILQYKKHGDISDGGGNRPTKAEQIDFVSQNEDSLLTILRSVPSNGTEKIGGRMTLVFCHWLIQQYSDFDTATDFIDTLINGYNLNQGSPILIARNYLLDSKKNKLTAGEKAGYIMTAWNKSCLGQSATFLRMEDKNRIPKKIVFLEKKFL